jgi:hypothetical protein
MDVKCWLKKSCPSLWSIMNEKAQNRLPEGIWKFIGEGDEDDIEAGKQHLQVLEKHVGALIGYCGFKKVGVTDRRDLSEASDEKRLAELSCEICLCASLGGLSSRLELRPPSGNGKFCDVRFDLQGIEMFGEAKRYEDTWLSGSGPRSRAIAKAPTGQEPHASARPRFMDLQSKLKGVPSQFPKGASNVLFIFHSGSPRDRDYIQQALFGQSNFRTEQGEARLASDGLFASGDWGHVSTCALVRLYPNGRVVCLSLWNNPNAIVQLCVQVGDALKSGLAYVCD